MTGLGFDRERVRSIAKAYDNKLLDIYDKYTEMLGSYGIFGNPNYVFRFEDVLLMHRLGIYLETYNQNYTGI